MYRLAAVLTVVVLLAVPLVAVAAPFNWGAYYDSSTKQYKINPADPVYYGVNDNNNLALPDGRTRSGWGGEWFDIEQLWFHLERDASNKVTRLDWLLVTSYAGFEPYEWHSIDWSKTDPSSNGAINHDTSYAMERDNRSTANSHNWAYRCNPVVALSFDGSSAYTWALVLDMGELANGKTDWTNQSRGDISTYAGLYKVNNPTAWQGAWINGEYRTDIPADLDTINDAALIKSGSAGSSTRSFAYLELDADQVYTNELWRQDYNWAWQGSIDLTGTNIAATGLGASVAPWCGNDQLKFNTPIDWETAPPVPEPSSVALVILALGAGLYGGGKRLRRKA
ncbi:MAG: PEP-CTERM sorting domain-containing protein [Armatimonadetes bacterium]|nr:PEP-CTERM sorting domain-containing protein [Armatimonadota bacterium]